MAPTALLVAASAVLGAALVSAQANPNYNYVRCTLSQARERS